MYARIFSQILDSSIAEDYRVRHVFQDLLILADRDGQVDMTIEAIARRLNIPMEMLMSALTALMSPDRHSRSSTEDGRRLVPLDPDRDWGWKIVNFASYNEIKTDDARRERNRRCQAAHRARLKPAEDEVSAVSAYGKRVPLLDVAVEVDLEADATKKETAFCTDAAKPPSVPKPPKVSWAPADGWQNIEEVDRAEWREAYPACDLNRQLAAMSAWLKANPAKAKKSNWRKFITNWLSRSQDKGGDVASNKPGQRQPADAPSALDRYLDGPREGAAV